MQKKFLPAIAGIVLTAAASTSAFAEQNQPWYKAWGPNTTGVRTPATNCAEYDKDMRPYLGYRASEIPEGFEPFGCTDEAWPSYLPRAYKGWYEAH